MDALSSEDDALSPERRELIELLLREEGEASASQIRPQPRDAGIFPLSFVQQRLWFINQILPGNTVYNETVAVSMRGTLDAGILRQSLNEIARRHEALRTSFTIVEGRAAQVIAPFTPMTLPLTDLRHMPQAEREAEAQRLARAEARQPFDLEQGPLIRTLLLRLAEEEYIALFTMHHIVTDGWSMSVLVRELATLYTAFSAGRPSPLPPLPVQYADYAVWQREWLSGDILHEQLDYWRRALAGARTALDLPTDRPRPAVLSFRGATQTFRLPASLAADLKALSQREGATLFMTLLAAWQVLLHRYSGQHDIVVGSPIAGRIRAETENLIGCFVNMLLLRATLTDNPGFRTMLKRVRAAALDAYARQELPFERLVEELQPQRDMSRNPLFQVMFSLHNTPMAVLDLPGLTLVPERVENQTAKFDLTLEILERADGLHGSLEYNTDLFDAATITRLQGHFQTLLHGIVTQPDQRISDLPLLTEAERRRMLIEWNATATHYSTELCIHHYYEARVGQAPDAVAVVFDEANNERRTANARGADAPFSGRPSSMMHLTYADLNRRANKLAHYLRRQGIGPEKLVGVCMERSLDLVVGILAILKAGGAYLPLDPAYPAERRAYMLEDAQTALLLAQERLLANMHEHAARALRIDADWPTIAGESGENVESEVSPANLAYVIYTSGSTGKPKGASISHANVARLFEATRTMFRFDERDVWTLFHSYAFDFSVWELWGGLLYGGRLIVIPGRVSRSPEAFARLLSAQRVTVLNQTPTAFQQIIQLEETSAAARKRDLRLVIFGGEALDLQRLKPWLLRHGDAAPQLINMYGITETTVHVTHRPIRMADLDNPARSVIGKRLPDLQAYVVSRRLQPVPVGAPGELYIGGDGLARGYLRRPDLTAERFVPNPFGTMNDEDRTMNDPTSSFIVQRSSFGARLYRTGDLARFRPDGELEYLGRIDDQVKLRGFRIELGEIAAVLGQHPAVRDQLVVPREDTPGDPRLVAYVVWVSAVSGQGSGVAASDELTPDPRSLILSLREWLAARLPDYMIPAAFVLLDALPLTPNGKVDRAALPAPEGERPELGAAYVAPRTPLEDLIARTWADALGLERVGVHDNFFELGGHSVLVAQVHSTLCQLLKKDLDIVDFFEYPTISALADFIGVGDDAQSSAQQGHDRGMRQKEAINRQRRHMSGRRGIDP